MTCDVCGRPVPGGSRSLYREVTGYRLLKTNTVKGQKFTGRKMCAACLEVELLEASRAYQEELF